MKEEWRVIEGFEKYQVSNCGNVFSCYTGKLLKEHLNHNGYSTVQLYLDGKAKTKRVHRLVAEAFIPNTEQLPEVDHLNSNKQDNSVTNLRWATGSLNTRSRAYSKQAKSKYNGVIPINNAKFQVNIFINGKTKHIGVFTEETKAAQAFNEFCIQYNLKRELNIITEA